MNIYWQPHHEVHPELAPDQDFVAYDEEREDSIGRVFQIANGEQAGRWLWTMTARSRAKRIPFPTHGVEDRRSDAEQRVVEAYRMLLEHNERHPRKSPARF